MSSAGMELRKGFDVENKSQKERMENLEENVNRTVLSKIIKILFVPNCAGLPLKDVVSKFLNEVVRYEMKNDPHPLTWYKHAGNNGDTCSFRAEMSHSFWEHFMVKGKSNLSDFNRKNKSKVKVIRGQTVKVSDHENLSLYLRKKIREECIKLKTVPPEITVKGPTMWINLRKSQEISKFKSTELAVKLGLDYSDWNGTPIRELLSRFETKNLEERTLRWGSYKLESLLAAETSEKGRRAESKDGHGGHRKREYDKEGGYYKKLRKDSQEANRRSN